VTKEIIEIIPSTKVLDLLRVYLELEDTLVSIAPPFKKLKNPFLKKSVAKVATLKHISSVGNVPLDELINKIRETVGQSTSDTSHEDENYFPKKPDWFSSDKIIVSVNEDRLEDRDNMTLVTILQKAKNLKKDEIIELTTTFLPAPGIDAMKSKGYSVWAKKENNNIIKSYFKKNTD
jgi:hypothetical protein